MNAHREVYQFKLSSELMTRFVAEQFAILIRTQFQPYRFYLSGNLGTGKTAFARYFLKKMGVLAAIKSPTYTLIELYDVEGQSILHSDLYRLNHADELYDLGLLEENHAVWLIEWAEKAASILPLPDIWFKFDKEQSPNGDQVYCLCLEINPDLVQDHPLHLIALEIEAKIRNQISADGVSNE